jgi:N-acyl homoserine lactone hydrolase
MPESHMSEPRVPHSQKISPLCSYRTWVLSIATLIPLAIPLLFAPPASAATATTTAAAKPAAATADVKAVAQAPVRLYALNCGTLEFKDLRLFADTGEYDGQTATIAVPCFLIRHPKGTLVWDTGLDPKFVQRSDNGARGIRATMEISVEKQLQQLNLKPTDITYLAFSHMHLDHTGNANLFTASTWILNRTEMQWASQPTGGGPVAPDTFSGYQHAKTQLIDGDYDVFGDGTVRILKAPGHTPGHQVLFLTLPKSGKVLLSGDLYHFRRDREQKLVPLFNTNRADTLASFDRIERLVANTKARLVIQHDPQDFKALPKFPAYLE